MSRAQYITRFMGGNWHGSYGLFPAPGHSKRDRSVSIMDAPDLFDGVVLHCHAGEDPLAVKDHLRGLGLLPEWQGREPTFTPRKPRPKPEPETITRHERAHILINEAVPADAAHPYLVRKGIAPHEAWQIDDRLVLPVMQPGLLVGLQFIGPDGSKKFLTGTRIKGSYWFLGDPVVAAPGGNIVIAEGFATAASIFEATGWPALISYTASNMKTVAQGWRKSLPDAQFVIAADDDTAGQKAAHEAAKAVGGRVMTVVQQREAA